MSCFTRRKDAPISLITQEVLRGLGALCQEPGTKTKDTFLIVSQVTNHSDLLLENSLLLSLASSRESQLSYCELLWRGPDGKELQQASGQQPARS